MLVAATSDCGCAPVSINLSARELSWGARLVQIKVDIGAKHAQVAENSTAAAHTTRGNAMMLGLSVWSFECVGGAN